MRRHLAVILAVALVAAGCGSSDEPEPSTPGQPDKISAGVIPIVDVAPIYLGKQKGFFSQRKIDLTLSTSQGGAALVPAVMSGQLQIGFSNVTSLLLASSKGLTVKAVSNGVASTGVNGKDYSGVVVKADSPVKTAADLAGKSVSVNTLQNIGDTTVRASVRKAGGDATAVKFTELPFPDAPAALQAGRVDAIWVVEPFLSAATGAGGRVVASNYVDTAPDLTVALYFTTRQFTEQKADLVKRFTEAMAESLRYAEAHPDEVRQVLGTYTQISPEVAAKLTLPKWPAEINRQSVQTLADLAVSDGLIEKAPDIDALLP
ncbi:MAG TPA: ABC transporter substrate-binding protein [Pilimelia sp.]|nr:ABC transporter substrate-binding protein [Pilimelia sp.]